MTTVQTIQRMRKDHLKKATDKHARKRSFATALLREISKKHGKEAVRLLTDNTATLAVPCMSVGRPQFDDFFTGMADKNYSTIPNSGRGLPRGRIIEIFGGESSGKTTLTLDWIAHAQRGGNTCAFIDAEHAGDPRWMALNGVDTDALLFSQPEWGEQASDIIIQMAKSGKVDLIVVDSVDALIPKRILDGEMEKRDAPGEHARLMSRLCRKLIAVCSKTNTTVVFINQIRMKIGVMFGNPEDTPGGKALKFYASLRIDVRKVSALKRAVQVKRVIGVRKNGEHKFKTERRERAYASVVRAKLIKSKVSQPFREVVFHIDYRKGITDFE